MSSAVISQSQTLAAQSSTPVALLPQVRSFQTSPATRDIDSAAKFIGAGAATVGVAGSGKHRYPLISPSYAIHPKPLPTNPGTAFRIPPPSNHTGIGIGTVFAALITGYARNPSLKQQMFSYAILGFALAEAMGLFCLMIAFLMLFAF